MYSWDTFTYLFRCRWSRTWAFCCVCRAMPVCKIWERVFLLTHDLQWVRLSDSQVSRGGPSRCRSLPEARELSAREQPYPSCQLSDPEKSIMFPLSFLAKIKLIPNVLYWNNSQNILPFDKLIVVKLSIQAQKFDIIHDFDPKFT